MVVNFGIVSLFICVPILLIFTPKISILHHNNRFNLVLVAIAALRSTHYIIHIILITPALCAVQHT